MDSVAGGSTLATYVYSYDNLNRVTTQVNNDGTYTYTYDNTNQLTGAYDSGTQVNSYAYDANGNRSGTGFATTVMNEQTASPGETYTYDQAGNLTAETNTSTHVTTSFTYDFRNRLREVTVGGTVVATYTYDALNRRIGIDDNGNQKWTVYDGTNPYADFSGGSGGALLDRYMFGPGVVDGAVVDELLARTDATEITSWYLMDKLGSVRDIAAALTGAVIDHVVYDSFGNVLSETSPSNGDRFKFAGMEWDGTVGQYYDHARGYDAAIGRFMSLDPMGFAAGDANIYRYVENAPGGFTDPTGKGGGILVLPPAGGTGGLLQGGGVQAGPGGGIVGLTDPGLGVTILPNGDVEFYMDYPGGTGVEVGLGNPEPGEPPEMPENPVEGTPHDGNVHRTPNANVPTPHRPWDYKYVWDLFKNFFLSPLSPSPLVGPTDPPDVNTPMNDLNPEYIRHLLRPPVMPLPANPFPLPPIQYNPKGGFGGGGMGDTPSGNFPMPVN